MAVLRKFRFLYFEEDARVWESIKKGIAEMIGTAVLVFLGCLGCVGSMGNTPSYLQICFSFGFAATTAITSVAHVSGAHINPAVTLGAVVCGHNSLLSALIYLTGQITGGVAGFGLLKVITPQNYLHGGNASEAARFCTTQLDPKITTAQGIICEMIATAILVFMSCAASDKSNRRNLDSVAIKFGLAVTVLCLGFVPYTGCSMNPARSFGPAVWNNEWSQHWVFWIGPLAGAAISSVLYRLILASRN